MAEEPVKPKGRNRNSQPSSFSRFEWALSLERERRGSWSAWLLAFR